MPNLVRTTTDGVTVWDNNNTALVTPSTSKKLIVLSTAGKYVDKNIEIMVDGIDAYDGTWSSENDSIVKYENAEEVDW